MSNKAINVGTPGHCDQGRIRGILIEQAFITPELLRQLTEAGVEVCLNNFKYIYDFSSKKLIASELFMISEDLFAITELVDLLMP